MELSDDEKRVIRAEVRQEIGRILKTWGTLLGVTNVIVLGSLLGYIFIVLPGRATEKVDERVNELVEEQQADINNKVDEFEVEITQKVEDIEEGIIRQVDNILNQVEKTVDRAIDKSADAFEDAVELKSSLNRKSSEVEEISRELTVAKEELQSIESNINEFSAGITVVQSNLEKVELSIQNFSEEETSQAVELVRLLGNGGQEFLVQQQRILSETTRNEVVLDTLDGRVAGLENDFENQLTGLKTEDKNQWRSIDELTPRIEELENKINELEGQVNQISTSRDE